MRRRYVQIGLHLSTTHHTAAPDVARRAERLGFHTIWSNEHLVFAAQMPHLSPLGPIDHPYGPPDRPLLDVFLYLGQVAAATRTIRIGTAVYILPLRHPIAVARSAMTLDVFSGGRFDFGIGIGWLPVEFEIVGQDWKNRGARADEVIELLRRLWTEPEVAHEGRYYRFPAVKFEPKPIQQPGPPVLVGGNSDAALRRAARLGNGWIGMGLSPEEAAPCIARLKALLADHGRTGHFQIILGAGNPDLDTVRRYEEAGATGLYVVLWNQWKQMSQANEAMGRFAERVLARL